MNRITINTALCKKCGICIEFCPKGVLIKQLDGTPKAEYIDKCIECKLCVLRCPDFAIELGVNKDDTKK